ncbi:MAG TPA: glycerol-3-phosphate dehydrogenase/oxidase, partial [Dehalococcoidia bacterium]|nr:glycerol-3-phosphate dehydrogenase/oxidase [Dehalococcoidia bacterium]
NGAGIARAAALAGYTVCLLEARDFGWGTTWRSTKLIHGGLRYLEHAEFGLVFESLRDQALLLREYPDLVRPISLLLPVYRGGRHGPLTIGLGLTLYDRLAYGRRLPGHRRLNAAEAALIEPALARPGLRGAFQYADSQAAYPERLALQTLFEATEAGAICLNHAEVVGLMSGAGRVGGVIVQDRVRERCVEIPARAVINAAGPWVDALLATLPRPPRRQIGGTRGAHLVVDYGGAGPVQALYAEARSDGRPFFIVPWRGRHLIGTTDTRYDGPPEAAGATESDVAYLLGEANALLPAAPLSGAAVQYGYAGVRPLPVNGAGPAGAITRRHLIRDHAGAGYAGLYSVIGGKLSTFRSLADDALHRLGPWLGDRRPRTRVDLTSGSSGSTEADAARWLLNKVGPVTGDHLRALYGPRLGALARIVKAEPQLLRPLCPHGPDLLGQVVLAAREEAAITVADVLLRRVGAGWNGCLGLDCAGRVAERLRLELGWSADELEQQHEAYAAEVQRTFYRPATPGSPPMAAGLNITPQ